MLETNKILEKYPTLWATGENGNGCKTGQQKAIRMGAECFVLRLCNIICTAGMLLSRYVIAIFLNFEGN